MSSYALCTVVLSAEGQVSGCDLRNVWDRCGSSEPVGDFRMQPFGPEIVAMVDRHARTTAAAINDLLVGAGEGQVPR